MTAELRAVMGNSWLRFVQSVDPDIVVVTTSHVGDGMQFLASVWREDGTHSSFAYLRSKDAAPLRVRIPVRAGRSFLFDEEKHDIANLADVAVFRAMHQAALERLLSKPDAESSAVILPFKTIDGGMS